MKSVSCHRTWALHQGLREYFDQVHVVTTSNRHIPPVEHVDTSGVNINDARTLDYRTLFHRRGKPSIVKEKSKLTWFGKVALRLQNSFPTIYFFGEGGTRYISNAVQIAEQIISTHRITHLLSTYTPYADHIIAARLKRMHPHLFWIADFRDLHIDPTQTNLYWRGYQEKINKRILKSADIITTVSEGLATHLRHLHPNVIVVPNGIREMTEKNLDLYPRFTISYTGSMFLDKRKPDSLLDALQQLIGSSRISESDIELIYAGKDDAVWINLIDEYGLHKIFRDRGFVMQKEAEQIQQQSHINLLLTYSSDTLKGNLTGKLYDYLGARRPILTLINGPTDPEIETIMLQTCAGAVFYHGDTEGLMSYISMSYQTWRETRSLMQAYNQEALDALKWSSIIGKFVDKIGLAQAAVNV